MTDIETKKTKNAPDEERFDNEEVYRLGSEILEEYKEAFLELAK